jgi:hypothetical protein
MIKTDVKTVHIAAAKYILLLEYSPKIDIFNYEAILNKIEKIEFEQSVFSYNNRIKLECPNG